MGVDRSQESAAKDAEQQGGGVGRSPVQPTVAGVADRSKGEAAALIHGGGPAESQPDTATYESSADFVTGTDRSTMLARIDESHLAPALSEENREELRALLRRENLETHQLAKELVPILGQEPRIAATLRHRWTAGDLVYAYVRELRRELEGRDECSLEFLEVPAPAGSDRETSLVIVLDGRNATVGRGGCADVHLALHQEFGMRAYKKALAGSKEGQQRLGVEAACLRQMTTGEGRTSNVPSYDWFDPTKGILMEHCQGVPIRLLGKQPPQAAYRIILGGAKGLANAHELDLVHRDLSPNNLLLTDTGRTKILDWGLARDQKEEEGRLTDTGQLLGTLGTIPPEAFEQGSQDVGPEGDIWALGVVLIDLLTGERIFERIFSAMDRRALRVRDSQERQVAAANTKALLRDKLSEFERSHADVVPLLMGMLAENPRDRFEARQTMQGLIALIPELKHYENPEDIPDEEIDLDLGALEPLGRDDVYLIPSRRGAVDPAHAGAHFSSTIKQRYSSSDTLPSRETPERSIGKVRYGTAAVVLALVAAGVTAFSLMRGGEGRDGDADDGKTTKVTPGDGEREKEKLAPLSDRPLLADARLRLSDLHLFEQSTVSIPGRKLLPIWEKVTVNGGEQRRLRGAYFTADKDLYARILGLQSPEDLPADVRKHLEEMGGVTYGFVLLDSSGRILAVQIQPSTRIVGTGKGGIAYAGGGQGWGKSRRDACEIRPITAWEGDARRNGYDTFFEGTSRVGTGSIPRQWPDSLRKPRMLLDQLSEWGLGSGGPR